MSERKINLEDVLTKAFNGKYWDIPFEPCKKAILEFGKQLLELAAENANLSISSRNADTYFSDFYSAMDDVEVNQQSILDTINQVE